MAIIILSSAAYNDAKQYAETQNLTADEFIVSLINKFALSKLEKTIMNYLFNFIAFMSLFLYVTDVVAETHNEFNEEMNYAYQWLSQYGQFQHPLDLRMVQNEDGLCYFSDRRNHCSCVVVAKDFWPFMDNPIIAYSLENSRIGMTNGMTKSYRAQIAALKKGSISPPKSVSTLYIPKHQEVKPLLGRNKWHQGAPYNMLCPKVNGKRTPVGCIPLAATIIMSYHKWPIQGSNHVYSYIDGNTIKLDFSTINPQWASYKDIYNPKDSLDKDIKSLAKLMLFMGISIEAQYNEKLTSSHSPLLKRTLCNNLGYSGHITTYYGGNTTEEERLALILKEIDEGRPCYVSVTGHGFVCDGYRDEFLHFNLGWGDSGGYYRPILGNTKDSNKDKNLMFISSLLCGIEPQRNAIIKEVALTKAGTLENVLSDNEKETVTNLTILGSLNSKDIQLLRKMAGAVDAISIDSWRGGSLRELNLKDALIKTDHKAYIPSKNYYCQRNTIGKWMFANCSSLTNIILPSSTERIDDYAFKECLCLQSITIPSNTKQIGIDPFYKCASLEKIFAPSQIAEVSTFRPICVGCSPILQSVTRY